MFYLIAGLVVFLGGHAFTMARDARAALIARLGEGGYKGLYSLVSAIGFILIVYGYGQYRAAGYIPVWTPPVWAKHITLTLMIAAVILLVAAFIPCRLRDKVRHPMLAAVKTWAFAHLLANGDLGSIILFGSFLVWAVVDRIALKRREAAGAAFVPADAYPAHGWAGDVFAIGIGLAVYAAFAIWLHPLLIGVAVLPH